VKQLRVEKRILKKPSVFFAKEMKYRYIRATRSKYSVKLLCNTLQVSRSAFYDWLERPAKLISEEEIQTAVNKLNYCPRKTRGYKTPYELFTRQPTKLVAA